jgi:preprotein translocase subunit SecA
LQKDKKDIAKNQLSVIVSISPMRQRKPTKQMTIETTQAEDMETIHDSNINGQLRQMANMIGDFGVYDFFLSYRDYLKELYTDDSACLDYLNRAINAYIRETHR